MKNKKNLAKLLLLLTLVACGKGEESFFAGQLTEQQLQQLRTRSANRCISQNEVLVERTIKAAANSFVGFDNKFHELFRADKTYSLQMRVSEKLNDENTTQVVSNYYIVDSTQTEFVYVVLNSNNAPIGLGKYSITKSTSDLNKVFNNYCSFSNGNVVSAVDLETLNVRKVDSVIGRTEEIVYKIKTILPGFFSKDAKSEIVSIKTTTDESKTTTTRSFEQNTLASINTPDALKSQVCAYVKEKSPGSTLNCSTATLADVGAAIRKAADSEE